MPLQILGHLASGEWVVDRYNSHLHSGVRGLLPEAFTKVNANGRSFLIEEVDFGRSIGETVCVPTGPGDQIVYAQRPGRAGLSRFVKNRVAEPCSSVVVILKAGDDHHYICITAFIGGRPEPEPWDRNATEQSEAFWNSHALIWGSEETIPGTETDECPW